MLHRNTLQLYISPYELPKFKLLRIFYFYQMHLMYIDQISLFLLYSDHFEQKYVKHCVLGQMTIFGSFTLNVPEIHIVR